jgi:peptidyl-tRNA hydrolase, PTH1 family
MPDSVTSVAPVGLQLIVGLGNPGNKYDQTRHNAGQELVLELARQNGVQLTSEQRYSGLYGRISIQGHALHLLIPTTYMNLSGQAVQALANFYKLPVRSMLVTHDELDLRPGIARFKQGGGHGGHNGLRDIISKLGGQHDFYRLRLGIGHPGNSHDVVSYVLKKAPSSERQLSQQAMNEALHQLPYAVCGHWQQAMQKLHSAVIT